MEGDRNDYEGATGNRMIVMDAGDGDIVFRIVNDNEDDGDVILLKEQVKMLIDDLLTPRGPFRET